jgi:hypothetical protein
MEKRAYAMVKALKDFITYVFHSRIITYVPSSYVKDILVQPDSDEKRGRWLAKIQEFDLEITLTKLVKGQGLAKLLAESNFRALGIKNIQGCGEDEDMRELYEQTSEIRIKEKFTSSNWYKNIVSYLLTLKCPSDSSPSKARTLKLHVVNYCISEGKLFWKDPLGFLLVCLVESKIENVISEFRDGVCGGDHAWRETAYKILRVGYYWPKLFSYVNDKVRACDPCKLFIGKHKLRALPLVLVKTKSPFSVVGTGFYGRN